MVLPSLFSSFWVQVGHLLLNHNKLSYGISSKIEFADSGTQCGNFRNFLPYRFYVKPILKELEVAKLPFEAPDLISRKFWIAEKILKFPHCEVLWPQCVNLKHFMTLRFYVKSIPFFTESWRNWSQMPEPGSHNLGLISTKARIITGIQTCPKNL